MRLIDADKLEDVLAKHLTHYYGDSDYYEGISQGFNLAIYDVKETPTIDAEPTRHGKWIDVKGSNGKDYRKCSECLHTQEITGLLNYCPVCGARMDEDASKCEELEINPCRGCEDYDGKGGCLSNGGCANVDEVEEWLV